MAQYDNDNVDELDTNACLYMHIQIHTLRYGVAINVMEYVYH
jgi:hypothetical protein